MPRDLAAVIAAARAEAKSGKILANWSGKCEKFVNNMGGFSQAFPTAMAAGSASGPLRTDLGNAPAGALLYFGGVWTVLNGVRTECGHVAYIIEQSADPLLLMASSWLDDNWGRNIGTIRYSSYQRQRGLPLRGWTLRHGTQTLTGAGTSGSGATPLEEDDMTLTPTQSAQLQAIWEWMGGGQPVTEFYNARQALGQIQTALADVQQFEGRVEPRIVNLDRQVTGADGFDAKTGPSVAGRLIAIQQNGVQATVDVDALAAKIIAGLPKAALTKADVVDALKSLHLTVG